MSVSYAGDTLHSNGSGIAVARPHQSVLLGLLTAIYGVVLATVSLVKSNGGLAVDVAGFGLVVAGVFVLFGLGSGLVGTGLALIVLNFGR